MPTGLGSVVPSALNRGMLVRWTGCPIYSLLGGECPIEMSVQMEVMPVAKSLVVRP